MSVARRVPLGLRIIAVEEDVYMHLVRATRDFEDSPSTVLRRVLGIDIPGSRIRRRSPVTRGYKPKRKDHEMSRVIESAGWLPLDIQRYLYLVGSIQRLRPIDFTAVLKLHGRTRRYFARTAREIEATGVSTQPRPILASGYWALTNIPMAEKQRILRNVMTLLGFTEDAMLAAREYLARGRVPPMP